MSTHVDTLPNFKVSDSFIHLFCKLLRAASVPLRTPSLLPHCLSLTVARCLISNLLRTHSPFGNYTLTRHNIRAGWPEKDPERSGDRGRKTVKQRVIMNGCSGGEVTRELNRSLGICKIVMFPVEASQLQSWKCQDESKSERAPRMRGHFVSQIAWCLHRNTHYQHSQFISLAHIFPNLVFIHQWFSCFFK